MALHFKVQLVAVADDDQQVSVEDLIVLDKEHERPEQHLANLPSANGCARRECLSARCGRWLGAHDFAERLPFGEVTTGPRVLQHALGDVMTTPWA